MILKNKYDNSGWWILGEYYCDITNELDNAFFGDLNDRKHYILARDCEIYNKSLPIRLPGFTCGEIIIDDNKIIKKIKFNSHSVFSKVYPENIEDILNRKYVDKKIIIS